MLTAIRNPLCTISARHSTHVAQFAPQDLSAAAAAAEAAAAAKAEMAQPVEESENESENESESEETALGGRVRPLDGFQLALVLLSRLRASWRARA